MKDEITARPARWTAVVSLAAGVFAMVGAEFFPASLLTPMAADLQVSEAIAGQAVTATALIGLLSALFTAIATRDIDRRWVILGLSVLLIASNLTVAFATGMPMLLLGRLLLGVALGGFWALAPALCMRLVPGPSVPKALSMLATGVSAATILAAPVGAWLGDLIGWRNVFLIGALLGLMVLLFQSIALPRLRPVGRAGIGALVEVLGRRGVLAGMLSIVAIVAGHMGLFTYIRPFLETVSHAGVQAVTLILLGFGIGNVVGNLLAGPMVSRNLKLALAISPIGIGTLAVLLSVLGGDVVVDGLLIAVWGALFGFVPVAWSAWITRMTPDMAEAGGALVIASFQAAITVGALAGGGVIAVAGPAGLFLAGGLLLALAVVVVVGTVRLPIQPAAA